MMTHTVFEKVKLYGSKRVACAAPGCTRKVVREKTFWATLNPFNKNPDETIRNLDDILVKLGADRTAWQAEPEKCREHKA